MSTTSATASEATEMAQVTGQEPAQKVRRFYSVGLHGADGSTMRIIAGLKKDGTATTYVTVAAKGSGGKKTSTRGATERHASMAAAKAAVEKLAAAAIKLGWARGKASGFTAKPDAFDASHLPAPGAAKSTSRK